ncbi:MULTISPECIES: hypothetical protein [unclassified Psychrobacter]|uniref:hypothetical protein n=1 Tax=unclassified Psychrobacter TaxID=196806 RepID=UPI0025F1F31C|nr:MULTISPECIES: hypothetical protein [unclassified Psychrobacter]
MHKTSFKSLLLIVMLPLIVSCETLNHQTSTQQHNELFFSYYLPKSTPEEPLIINPTAITTEFKYENGCLLAFDGSRWMTPVFPEGHATFDSHNKTLKLLETSYKMGEVISAAGYVHPYNSDKVKNYSNTPAKNCITEYLAIYYGDYEKIDLDKN